MRIASRHVLLLGLASAPVSLSAGEVHHEFLAAEHPEGQRRVEYFWTAPSGDGPWPAMVYVHGHQFPERPGARRYLNPPLLERTAADGFVAAAVSQPGYGQSDGPPDFCGPASQDAVRRVLQHLRRNPKVDPRRIVLYGYSRGAMTSSMVAAQEPSLAGVILGGGAYDLQDSYARLREGPPGRESLKANIRNEAGATPEAFRRRSALLSKQPIRVPTLILHGEDDPVAFVDQARRLEKRLKDAGTPVTLVVFPGVRHGIPRDQRKPHVAAFLKKHLGAAP